MNVINTYHVGYPDIHALGAGFLVVLTRGNDGTHAVYSGIVYLPAAGSEEYDAARELAAKQVARHGSKESYQRAVTFYPGLKREEYRA